MSIIIWLSESSSNQLVFSREYIKDLDELHHYIELKLGIPRKLHVLYFCNRSDVYLDLNKKIADDIWGNREKIELKFFVRGTSDPKIIDICDQYKLNSGLGYTYVRKYEGMTIGCFTPKVYLTVKKVKETIALDEKIDNMDELYILLQDPFVPVVDSDFVVDFFFLESILNRKLSTPVWLVLDCNTEDRSYVEYPIHRTIYLNTPGVYGVQCQIAVLPSTMIFVEDIKKEIESIFEIPTKFQVLHVGGKRTKDSDMLRSYFGFTAPDRSLEISLTVLSTNEVNVLDICQKQGIRVLSSRTMIILGRNNESVAIYRHKSTEDTVLDLQNYLAAQFGMPVESIVLYHRGKTVTFDQVLVDFYIQEDRCCFESIVMNLTLKPDVVDNAKLCGIDILPNRIKVILQGKTTTLHELPLVEFQFLADVKVKLKELYDIPQEFQILYIPYAEILRDSEPIVNIFNYEVGLEHSGVLYLTFKATENPALKEFCKNYEVSPLQTVCIDFLTSQRLVNIAERNLNTVFDLKTDIYLESPQRRSFVHLQKLFLNKREVQDSQRLIDLYLKHGDFSTGGKLVFSFFILPPEKFKIEIRCRFIKERSIRDSLVMELLETESIAQLAERIEKISKVKSKYIEIIDPTSQRPFDDVDCKVTLLRNRGPFRVQRIVHIEIHEPNDTIFKKIPLDTIQYDRFNSSLSVQSVIKQFELPYKEEGKKLILDESLNDFWISESTNLQSVVNTSIHLRVIRVIRQKSCTIM